MSYTRTAATVQDAARPSIRRLLLTALALVATILTAGFARSPVAVTARGPSAPHPSPRITPEQANALAVREEVGENDFRVSDMGGIEDPDYGAHFCRPAVAYNSAANEYLVVWRGEDNTGGLVDGEIEIFGQRVDAATGGEVGANDFRISDMGGTGDPEYDGLDPTVACSGTQNEYLTVWGGDDDTGELTNDEFEIFGQRVAPPHSYLPLVLRQA